MPTTSGRILDPSDICLITTPRLAKAVGRTEAIFLQQLHYWLSSKDSLGTVYEGKQWIYNTYQDWQAQLKIVSLSTIRRVIKKLEQKGIISTSKLNRKASDQTKWYTLNYEKLNQFLSTHQDEPPLFKMNTPSVQNELIFNKDSKNTSENKLIPSDALLGPNRPVPLQQVNAVENKEQKFVKRNTAQVLLHIWNETVEKGREGATLTKKRSQHLVAAFKYKFASCLHQWQKFCHRVATSDFLMGKVKATFRATLDWVLRFEVLQRIVEGQFGVQDSQNQDRKGEGSSTASIPLQQCLEHIEQSDELPATQQLRQKLAQCLGAEVYQHWFAKVAITLTDTACLIQSPNRFHADHLDTHYGNTLQKLVPLPLTYCLIPHNL